MKAARTEDNKLKPVGTWLSPRQYEKLMRIARRERRSASSILRFLVDKVIKAGESGIA